MSKSYDRKYEFSLQRIVSDIERAGGSDFGYLLRQVATGGSLRSIPDRVLVLPGGADKMVQPGELFRRNLLDQYIICAVADERFDRKFIEVSDGNLGPQVNYWELKGGDGSPRVDIGREGTFSLPEDAWGSLEVDGVTYEVVARGSGSVDFLFKKHPLLSEITDILKRHAPSLVGSVDRTPAVEGRP